MVKIKVLRMAFMLNPIKLVSLGISHHFFTQSSTQGQRVVNFKISVQIQYSLRSMGHIQSQF